MFGAILTATVTESVTGTSDLDIHGKTIAVLNNSFESLAIARDYRSHLKNFNSYEEVLDAVRNDDEVFAGVMLR